MSLSQNALNRLTFALADPGAAAELATILNQAAVGGSPAFANVALTGLLTESGADGLTALGTNQATALQLAKQVNRITAGASTTGVLLPAAVAGQIVVVVNDVANGINVFGAGTDTINDVATATGIVQPGVSAAIYFCTTSGPAGKWYCMISSPGAASFGELPPYKLSTGTTTTTFTAAEMTGAAFTVYTSTAATPGSIATATAAAMFAAIPNAYVGMQWVLRIINDVPTNSMTITADASVTLSGKTTYVLTPFEFQDYLITFTSPTAATMKFIGGGVGSTA